MQPARSTFILLVFVLCSAFCFSQQKWPGSFLWRISGNGLSKPSYLYGTIHLQDKRLFQFTDSLYHSLESVDGFALEVDFSEFIDSVFSRSLSEAENNFLNEKQKVKVDKKKIDKSVDSILRKLKIDIDHLTKKDLKRIRDYRMNSMVQQGEMKTIVDGYLYGLALRLGKWTGGIEDVVDQLDVMDEMGANLTPDEVFQPEANMRLGLQEMIKIYVNRDLQTLADYVDGSYSKNVKDEVLIHRNVKMARRMDSLSKLRTMFFAVGAAHLPGDSGVISLLRSRGFTVEPIFSPQSLTPEVYSARLNTIPWKKVESDELYSVEMPGGPSDFNLFGQAVKMKIFFDLPTMTFYMAGRTLATASATANIDNALEGLAERMGSNSKRIVSRDVSTGDIKGKEGRFDIDEYSYVVRFLQKKSTLYILMVGSSKKSNLDNSETEKFFSSFSAKEIATKDKTWTEFSIQGKGFTMKLPGKPVPDIAVDKRAEGSNWNFFTYDLMDNERGLYFLIQVREIQKGYFLEGDTTFFSYYKKSVSGRFRKVLNEEKFQYKGWPADKLDFDYNGNAIYRVYILLRGNRVYLFAVGGDKNADLSDIDEAFNSLTFQDLPLADWSKYQSHGFTSTAPSMFYKKEDSTDKEQEHFISFDPNELIGYEVFRRQVYSNYWIKNDSLYFEAQLKTYKHYRDSVLRKEFVYNGKLKAIDFVIQKPENNALKRIRVMVSGDSVYTLLSIIPSQQIDNENTDKFFRDFRVAKELEPTIYKPKAKELLEALKTTDSIAFTKASVVFDKVNFEEGDRSLLQQALLEKYPSWENTYRSVNARIVDVLAKIANDSTVDFIKRNYKSLAGEKEQLKYNLLELLAKMKTQDSYVVMKQLLLESLPAEGDENRLSYHLRDSMLLTKNLYPEILKLSTDSAFAQLLVEVTNQLIDSSMISVSDVIPYKQNFLMQARKNLRILQRGDDKWWPYSTWISFISRFNDKESNQLLTEFSKIKSVDVKYCAIVELVRNSQTVNPIDIEKIAADKSYRLDLYNEFKKMDKLKLFPIKYSTQKMIAESEIYQVASSDNDDNAPGSTTFLEERTVQFMGKTEKFYLFKISFSGEDHSSSYLGITGPYSITTKELIPNSKASAIFWDEEFDKSKLNEQFKQLLSNQEENLKEDSVENKEIKK